MSGCAASRTLQKPTFAPQTTLKMASAAYCTEPSRCVCRSLESSSDVREEGIAKGHKRFEFRLPRSTSAIWISVEQLGVFFKAPTEVEPTCFYLDLPEGEHRVTVLGEDRDAEVGLHVGLLIYEYGEKNGVWYRAMNLACGGVNRCASSEIAEWKRFQTTLPRGVLDPCGSVMIKGVSYTGSYAERGDDYFNDLTVAFTMKVYDFAPQHAPLSSECKAPIPNR